MENAPHRRTTAEARTALDDAEAARATLAHRIATPSWFFASLGGAVAVQIATTAIGLGAGAPWLLAGGLGLFAVVAGLQLARFRRRNGVWLGGFASRVVLGTGSAASLSYVATLAAAIWSAYEDAWWLMALWSALGGAAYARSGVRWMRAYRGEPAAHAQGESLAFLTLMTAAAVGGLALLVLGA